MDGGSTKSSLSISSIVSPVFSLILLEMLSSIMVSLFIKFSSASVYGEKHTEAATSSAACSLFQIFFCFCIAFFYTFFNSFSITQLEVYLPKTVLCGSQDVNLKIFNIFFPRSQSFFCQISFVMGFKAANDTSIHRLHFCCRVWRYQAIYIWMSSAIVQNQGNFSVAVLHQAIQFLSQD